MSALRDVLRLRAWAGRGAVLMMPFLDLLIPAGETGHEFAETAAVLELLQRWAHERGATVAFVDEDIRRQHDAAVALRSFF